VARKVQELRDAVSQDSPNEEEAGKKRTTEGGGRLSKLEKKPFREKRNLRGESLGSSTAVPSILKRIWPACKTAKKGESDSGIDKVTEF